MDEIYVTHVDDECFDNHDYNDDTDQDFDTDDDTDDEVDQGSRITAARNPSLVVLGLMPTGLMLETFGFFWSAGPTH